MPMPMAGVDEAGWIVRDETNLRVKGEQSANPDARRSEEEAAPNPTFRLRSIWWTYLVDLFRGKKYIDPLQIPCQSQGGSASLT